MAIEGASAVLLLRDPGKAEVRIFASSVSLPAGVRLDRFELLCRDAVLGEGTLFCSAASFNADRQGHGPVSGEVGFEYQHGTGLMQVVLAPLRLGKSVVEGSVARSASGWQAELIGKDLSVPVLRGLLEAVNLWPPGYEEESGRLDVAVRLAAEGGELVHAEGAVRTKELGFYGQSSAEALDLDVTFGFEAQGGWSLKVDGRMSGGVLFVQAGGGTDGISPGVLLEAGDEPIEFGVGLGRDMSTGALNVGRLRLVHPGVARISGSVSAMPGETWSIRSADIRIEEASAGPLYQTWLQPFLVDTPFSALELEGAIDAALRMENGGLRDLEVRISDLHAYDEGGRFAMAGLRGDMRVTSGAEEVSSTLEWDGVEIYRLQFGGGALTLSSRAGNVEVAAWRDVPFLDGMLHIETLEAVNAGRPGMQVTMSGELTPVSMADLTQQLGWPIMSGQLSGRIEGLRWEPGRLAVGGLFHVRIFDGDIQVRDLRVEDLFGLVPQLYADIRIRGIDLAQLTERFSFGKIEGRLDGKIAGLQLEAWEPVYFEAELATPADDDSRHRISQRAVDNLGFIGGGATGALSGGLLRYFEDYSYGRLGIRCTLVNGTCHLGGVEDTGDGFLIVTRGGLLPPWIEVRGRGRSIGWEQLKEALRSVTSGSIEVR